MPVLVQKREGCIEVVSKFAHVRSSQGGSKLGFSRSTGSGFRDTSRFKKLPYLGMKLTMAKVLEVPQGILRSTGSGLQDTIWADFQNCHIWA